MISSEKFLFLHLIKLKCWMKKSVSAVYKKYQPWSQSCFDKEEMLRTWANCPLPVESTDLICYLVSRTRSTPKCNKSFGSLIRLTISIQVIKCCWASFPTCKNYQLKLCSQENQWKLTLMQGFIERTGLQQDIKVSSSRLKNLQHRDTFHFLFYLLLLEKWLLPYLHTCQIKLMLLVVSL